MPLSRSVKVCIVLGFSITLFLAEVIVGYVVGSIALIADSFHMLNDVLGFVVALAAMRLAKSDNYAPQYTYGWKRAEVLGALINAVLLLGLCLTIYIEAIQRFFRPSVIESPQWIMGVGCAGLFFNCVGIFLFHDTHVHGHGTCGGASHSHGHALPHDSLDHDGHNDEDTLEGSDTDSDVQEDPRQTIVSILPPNERNVIYHPAHVHSSIIDAAANLSASYRERLESPYTPATPSEPSDRTALLANTGAPFDKSPVSQSYQTLAHTPGPSQSQLTGSAASPPPRDYTGGVGRSPAVPGRRRASVSSHHTHPDAHHHHGGSSGSHLNMRGVLLHVLGDALANLAVIATALVIWWSDSPYRFYFDPAISIVINTFIVYFTLPLVKSASYILLQSAPSTVSIGHVRSDIQTIPGVLSIHELHIWELSDTQIIGSVHVFVPKSVGEDGFMRIAAKIKHTMHRHGIHSTTIQPEFVQNAQHVEDNIEAAQTACILRCAQSCTTPSCCPVNDLHTRLIGSGSPEHTLPTEAQAHHPDDC
ncbi:Zinc resistance conferring protein [Dimargaris verticillata]|uniref:Zinc resistance conferring protein n=1 Tax=Dimargaris verticillata TaxID=2761393 RepID=A0A9W8EEZ0_9FUNG|nr:Zinc resistance conferring protein [Dimargaris verticillata]